MVITKPLKKTEVKAEDSFINSAPDAAPAVEGSGRAGAFVNTFLLPVFIASISLFSAASKSTEIFTNPLDAKYQRAIDRYNSKLPTMVAPSLRQERASLFNGVITYRYTSITKTSAELARMNLEDKQRPYIFPAICKAPDTGRMLREGASFRYLYFGKDGNMGAQLIFIPSDCSQFH
jgi:hypothetical protein